MWLFNYFSLLILFIFNCWGDQQLPESVTPPIQTPPQQEEIIMAIFVPAGKVECIYQPIVNLKYNSFEVDYQVLFKIFFTYFSIKVIEGGENDISFILKSPSGIIIASEQQKTDGSHKYFLLKINLKNIFRIVLDEPNHGRGDYAFCFDNSFSYSSDKRVYIFN